MMSGYMNWGEGMGRRWGENIEGKKEEMLVGSNN